jgi:hypothetical protein
MAFQDDLARHAEAVKNRIPMAPTPWLDVDLPSRSQGAILSLLLASTLLLACTPAPAAPDAGPPAGTCLPGSTAADCDLCTFGAEQCERACPTDCGTTWPLSPACTEVCSGKPCCACGPMQGNEFWWQPKTVSCATACTNIVADWKAAVAADAITACATDADCSAAGGPRQYCDCSPALHGCGMPVNRDAYARSPAPALEAAFFACHQAGGICDCGPVRVACVQGRCVETKVESCFGPRDGGS